MAGLRAGPALVTLIVQRVVLGRARDRPPSTITDHDAAAGARDGGATDGDAAAPAD